MTPTPEQQVFFNAVLKELEYANHKHVFWPDSDAVHASAIVSEECGKLTQASIDFTYSENDSVEECAARMRRRAVSTAAMALQHFLHIDHYTPCE